MNAALPLIFLPGMMCDERLFAPQIDVLRQQRDVSVMDIGRFDTMAALANDVLSKAPEHFALAGLSMGGILAMEVIRQAPGRVKKLALMDTNPRAEIDEVKASRAVHLDRVSQGDMLGVMKEVMIPKYLHQGFPRPEIDQLCVEMARTLGDQVFINQSLALRDRPDQQDTLAKVRVPTLILMGEDDQLCPLDRHETMKALIPHANFVVVEKAGHLPTLEQPEATSQHLSDWLNS
ncbi:alpha/beta fold hydrolase [Veronia pacifica]|uniref:Alpha/beta hydrolase n=1 Tax=Veronia pacifica TaxID=1080227 RepID=A0A1C3E7V5_9GAMM|nr:alpha/beta fold hydrolase [Veronia pacifica]ODA29330.1 alpha/beta hydrolase [Veronia pacifica]